MLSKPATNLNGEWKPVENKLPNNSPHNVLIASPPPTNDTVHWISTTVNSKGALNIKQIAEYPYVTSMSYGLNLTPFIVHLKTQDDLDKFMAKLSKTDETLNYLFNLRSIDLSNGIFTSIKSVLEIFTDTIIFAHNQLMHLELDSLVIYRKLDVSHNLLETVKLSNCQIEELNLSHNNITEIALVDCTVCTLNLSHNKLRTFDWKHLPDELKEINVTNNFLDICDIFGVTVPKLDVSRNVVNKHPVLRNCFIGEFSANKCGIETILFSSCMIGNLELYGNLIRYFPNPNSDELPDGLSSLDLSSNQMEGDLELTRFTISYLDIGFNNLTSIHLNQCAFYYFIAPNNEISNMEYTQTGIVFLDLSANKIKSMFPSFPRDVEVLILNCNQLVNFYINNPICKTIRKLDLADNNLIQFIWNQNWLSNVTDLQLDNNPKLTVSNIQFSKVLNYLSVSKTKDNSTYEIERLKTFAKRVDLEWNGDENAKHRISYFNHHEDGNNIYLQDVLDKGNAKSTLSPLQIQDAPQTDCKQQITLDIDDRDFDDDAKLRMQTIKDAKGNATNTNPLFSDDTWTNYADDINPPKSVTQITQPNKFWNTNYFNNQPPLAPAKQYSKPIPITTRWTYKC